MILLLILWLFTPQSAPPLHPCDDLTVKPIGAGAGSFLLTFCSPETGIDSHDVILDGYMRPPVVGRLVPTVAAPSAKGLYAYQSEVFAVGVGVHTLSVVVHTAAGWSAPSVPIVVTVVALGGQPPPGPPATVDPCTLKPLLLTTSYWPPLTPGANLTVVAKAEGWQKATFTRLAAGRFTLDVVDARGCTATITK